MRLGITVDMRNSNPEHRGDVEHYQVWLDRVARAEQLGCPSVWLTEHHFFDDGYLPQCWTLAAAIAARTSTIRIGTAVALLPLHLAIEVAEQVALVDILSGGRVDPGFGVGYRKPEYDAFGGNFKQRYGEFRRRIVEMRELWGEQPGAPRTITPRPVQRPVPIWGGFRGPQGARLAGRLGLGLLSIERDLLEPYRAGLEEGGHDPAIARMGGLVDIWITDDPDRTWAQIEPFVAQRWQSYNRYMFEGTRLEHTRNDYFDARTTRDSTVMGDAATVAEVLRTRFEGLPVTDIHCWTEHPGLDDDTIDANIEAICTQLVPLLADA